MVGEVPVLKALRRRNSVDPMLLCTTGGPPILTTMSPSQSVVDLNSFADLSAGDITGAVGTVGSSTEALSLTVGTGASEGQPAQPKIPLGRVMTRRYGMESTPHIEVWHI